MNFNPPSIHLFLNHLPVVGSLGVLLVLVAGLVRRREEIVRLALGLALLVALASVAAFRTGEPSEDWVKHEPGVVQDRIEEHEAVAKVALGAALLMGLVAGFGLGAHRGRPLAGWVGPAMLVLALGATALLTVTAHKGGMIRHSEIRPGAKAPPPEAGEAHH